MTIQELNKYYQDETIIQKEWFNKLVEITSEDNSDYIFENLTEKLKSELREIIKKYPTTAKGWKNMFTVQSYCGTMTDEQYKEHRKSFKSHQEIIVNLFREKLRES